MRNKAPKLTRSELLERLSYDPITGIFLWKAITPEQEPCERKRAKYNNQHAGNLVGVADTQNGMPRASIGGRIYYMKTIAFLFMTGVEPTGRTGFLDGNRSNAAWSNLCTEREAKAAEKTRQYRADQEARRDNESIDGGKLEGVRWCPQSGRYWAFVAMAFVNLTVGHYRSATAAVEARDSWITLNT